MTLTFLITRAAPDPEIGQPTDEDESGWPPLDPSAVERWLKERPDAEPSGDHEVVWRDGDALVSVFLSRADGELRSVSVTVRGGDDADLARIEASAREVASALGASVYLE